ncbi:MAG: SLBB domain-containing protein [Chloroflexota bacterium]
MKNNRTLVMPIILMAFLLIPIFNLYSQVDYNYLTGARKGQIDTLALGNAQQSVSKFQGLLEREIDPSQYIVGPGDVLMISILAAQPIQYTTTVTPEGKLILRNTGVVNVKGMTLEECYAAVRKQISKYSKSEDIEIALVELRSFKVGLSGSVSKPMSVDASPADRVSEIIDKAGGLKYGASMRHISILRETNGGAISIPVDLVKYYLTNDKSMNPVVRGGDQIRIPQSSDVDVVEIYGDVMQPGIFEYKAGDKLSDLVRFAQGFQSVAFLDSVEVVRFDGKGIESIILNLNDPSWYNILSKPGTLANDIELRAGDRVYVRRKVEWKEPAYAMIDGAVRYPGRYAIQENRDKANDLITRAGGFTDDAYLQGAEFIRQRDQRYDPELERLKNVPMSEMSESEIRYFQTRKFEKPGIVSINFAQIRASSNSKDNIELINRDSIYVPKKNEFVNVQGRVNSPGLVAYNANYTYEDYITQAGGLGYRADESEITIAKPRGQIFGAKEKNYKIEPGDVILVPPKNEKTFGEIFTQTLTIITQLVTIAGIVITLSRL